MACEISYKNLEVPTNNSQFFGLIEFAIEIGGQSARAPRETSFVDRMAHMHETEFWSGSGIQIEKDFSDIEEQKFWARVFLDTARAIVDRRIGRQDYFF